MPNKLFEKCVNIANYIKDTLLHENNEDDGNDDDSFDNFPELY